MNEKWQHSSYSEQVEESCLPYASNWTIYTQIALQAYFSFVDSVSKVIPDSMLPQQSGSTSSTYFIY
jgi:hypothetical protein